MKSQEDNFHVGVKALILNDEGKVLLLRLHPSRYRVETGCWDLPGGRVQRGESFESTLRRELKEETGIESIIHMIPFTMSLSKIRIPIENSDVGLIFAIYLCEVLLEGPICLASEHVEFNWVWPAEAAELLKNGYPGDFLEKMHRTNWVINEKVD